MINQIIGIGSYLFVFVVLSAAAMTQHLEEEQQTVNKDLCFSASFFVGKLVAKQRNGTVGTPVLASPFFVAWPIPIDTPTKQKVGIGGFPFSYFLAFPVFILTKEMIDQTIGVSSYLFVFVVSSTVAMTWHLEEEQQTIGKDLCFSASFFVSKLVAEQWNGTVGAPVLTSPFFVTWPITINIPTEQKVGIGGFHFSYFLKFFQC